MRLRNTISYLALLMVLSVFFSSCGVHNYYRDWEKKGVSYLPKKLPQHKINPGDKLSHSVWGHPDLSVGSIFEIYNADVSYGRWIMVEEDGHGVFPALGRIKVEGLTVEQAQKKLTEKLVAKDIREPIVVVRVLNREVTVLGEVNSPGNFLLEREDHTLGQMIAEAGGTLTYADLKKVRLVRKNRIYELDLTREKAQLDLEVQAGDLITVPSRKGKMFDKKAPTLIPITSALTATIVVISFIQNQSR